MDSSHTHWRNSMKPARFFFLDARAAVPFVIAMLHLRWYTLVFAFITTMIFYFLELRGLDFFAALRAFRCWLITKKRPNIRHSDLTRWVDFAFEDTEKNMRKLGAMNFEPDMDEKFDSAKPAESAMKAMKKTVKKIQKKMLKKAPASMQQQPNGAAAQKTGASNAMGKAQTGAKTVSPAAKPAAKK